MDTEKSFYTLEEYMGKIDEFNKHKEEYNKLIETINDQNTELETREKYIKLANAISKAQEDIFNKLNESKENLQLENIRLKHVLYLLLANDELKEKIELKEQELEFLESEILESA